MIRAGFAGSPFGSCFFAECPHGICRLSFDNPTALGDLEVDWPNARIERDDAWAAELCERIFVVARRPRQPRTAETLSLQLFVKGTDFQVLAWRALLEIPAGRTVRYGELAAMIGAPKAARAVGSAVGNNPIAFLIPCHRVVRGDSDLGGYAWGRDRKREILAWEGPI